jgi:inorganic pyrophosphatase
MVFTGWILIAASMENSLLNRWDLIDPQDGCPKECFLAVIEVPLGSSNKYELDKKTGLLRLDRILHSAVHYPANYGFIPQTLAEDGDALDVLVVGSAPLHPLTVVPVRPIGLLEMEDQRRVDNKIVAVAPGDPDYSDYREAKQLPPHKLAVLKQFFEDYKVLERKEVVVKDFRPAAAAISILKSAIDRYQAAKTERH